MERASRLGVGGARIAHSTACNITVDGELL
jgi:hypothetical protein